MPAAGSAIRAHMISSSNRGAVAHLLQTLVDQRGTARQRCLPQLLGLLQQPLLHILGAFTSPRLTASGTANTINKSRNLSRRSSANLRGS